MRLPHGWGTGLFHKDETHERHRERKNKSIAKTLDLDRLSSATPNNTSDHRHREARNYRADQQTRTVKSRRMDKWVWNDREAKKACRTACNCKHHGGEQTTDAARNDKKPSNRSRDNSDKDLKQNLGERFAENFKHRTQ